MTGYFRNGRPRLVADGHEHGELYCEITSDRQIELA